MGMYDDRLILLALEEDVGPGDVTTEGLIETDRAARARVVAREPLVLAGLGWARRVFHILDPEARFESVFKDGDFMILFGLFQALFKGGFGLFEFAHLKLQLAEIIAGIVVFAIFV